MDELPTAAEISTRFRVSRGTALRVLGALRNDGMAQPVSGGRWRVIRDNRPCDPRPLHERLLGVFSEGLSVGDPFPSSSSLAERFEVSRPTMSKALHLLEDAGWLSNGGQGRPYRVAKLPG